MHAVRKKPNPDRTGRPPPRASHYLVKTSALLIGVVFEITVDFADRPDSYQCSHFGTGVNVSSVSSEWP